MKALFILLIITADLLPLKTVHHRSVQPLIKQVPVLVYHNISKYPAKENLLFISEKNFARQLKGLYDSGYHAILPNQLAAYYNGSTFLPAKPVIISFDDSNAAQYTLALPALKQYGFKAVFFVMTVTINKKGFFSSGWIKEIEQQGHIIGAHTWDHPNLKHQLPNQLSRQLMPPKKTLEAITGKTVDCFAYPYGAWDENLLAAIQKAGFATAFQLTNKSSNQYPLLTIRRMMVNGAWMPSTLIQQMDIAFP